MKPLETADSLRSILVALCFINKASINIYYRHCVKATCEMSSEMAAVTKEADYKKSEKYAT